MAKARFDPTPVDPESGVYTGIYTGIFANGSENAIIRLSETDIVVPGVTKGWLPSFAIKFLRDSIYSANQFGMVAFEQNRDDWDFFGHFFQSHLPDHEGECGPKTIAKFNSRDLHGEIF